jgi:hypothetical protein
LYNPKPLEESFFEENYLGVNTNKLSNGSGALAPAKRDEAKATIP